MTDSLGMSTAEISEFLADVPSWSAAGLPARNAFKLAMKGRLYGREALIDAWASREVRA